MAGSVAVAVGKSAIRWSKAWSITRQADESRPDRRRRRRRHGPGDPRRASRPRGQLSRHRQERRRATSRSTAAAIRRPTASCSAPAWSISVKPDMRVWSRKKSSARCSPSSARTISTKPWPSATNANTATAPAIFTRSGYAARAVQAALQRRHDRHQRRRAGPDGLVPLHRLEPIVLRRPAHPGRWKACTSTRSRR